MKRSFQNRLIVCVVTVLAFGTALSADAAASDAATVQLKTVTTNDKTASARIPADWTFVRGGKGFIEVTGPHHGEEVDLGVLVIGKNASAGAPLGGEVAFALPFGASLEQKFTTIVHSGAAKQGMPEPQITIAGAIPTRLPMCSRLLGGWIAGEDSLKFEGVICSLQPDFLGLYKNLMFLAQVPSSLAAQDRPIVEKIAASYRVTPAMFKKMLAPYTALPPHPAGGAMAMPRAGMAMPGLAPYQDPTNADCFDYNNIRQSPPWEVPMHCGGYAPG